MGVFRNGIYKSTDYYWMRSDYKDIFKLSDIDSKFMKRHHISGTVKEFKDKVRKSKPFAKVKTGNYRYNYRSTPLYNIKDFNK